MINQTVRIDWSLFDDVSIGTYTILSLEYFSALSVSSSLVLERVGETHVWTTRDTIAAHHVKLHSTANWGLN